MAARLLILLLALGLLVSLAPPVAATDAPPEDQLLWMINDERGDRGLPPMVARDDVRQIAVQHSADMQSAGDIFHNDAYFTDESHERLHARRLGENVAVGGNLEGIHEAFMQSDGHRANILDPGFVVVGIGALQDDRGWWITEDFVEPEP